MLPAQMIRFPALMGAILLVSIGCTEVRTCKCPDDAICGIYKPPGTGGDKDTSSDLGEADLIHEPEIWGELPSDITYVEDSGIDLFDSFIPFPEDIVADIYVPELVPVDIHEEADLEPDIPLPPVEDGTPENPFVVDQFPYVQDNNTSFSPTSQFDYYACADWLGEEGPEFYYKVILPQSGDLRIEVGEDSGVDVDIHLLSGLGSSGGMANECLKRANTELLATGLSAGTYWVVIDSYSEAGKVFAGGYRVALELDLWDVEQVVEVGNGVVWKKKIYSNYCGGVQTVNTLAIDLNNPAVVFKPYWQNGCIHVNKVGEQEGAVAAMNAGFFSSGCQSLCFIKIDGSLKVMNHIDGNPRRTFGISQGGAPMFSSVNAWSDWPEAHQGFGGHPNLVTDGQIDVWPYSSDGFYTSRHPRTALGLTGNNILLMVTVDGRTSAGKGMTINELAQHMIYLGAVQAINLDGGGSTTMWIDDMTVNGIVNFPSDNQKADHHGQRLVSDALLIFIK